METITFLRFFRAAYLRGGPRTTFADQGPSKTVAFFWIPSKMFISGTWNFRIIEKNIKAIFREYFSSLREDSGKIFKLMTFRREPRTTHCTTNHQQEIVSLSEKKERPETNNSLLIPSLASQELKLNIRILLTRKCKWLDQRTHQEISLTRSRRISSKK